MTGDRADDREFVIVCRSTLDGGAEPRESTIVVMGNGEAKRKAPIGHFIEDLTQMLWIDAFEHGPWTPSFIESVTITQKGGSVMTYSRAGEAVARNATAALSDPSPSRDIAPDAYADLRPEGSS